jgi:hypothetical protein
VRSHLLPVAVVERERLHKEAVLLLTPCLPLPRNLLQPSLIILASPLCRRQRASSAGCRERQRVTLSTATGENSPPESSIAPQHTCASSPSHRSQICTYALVVQGSCSFFVGCLYVSYNMRAKVLPRHLHLEPFPRRQSASSVGRRERQH